MLPKVRLSMKVLTTCLHPSSEFHCKTGFSTKEPKSTRQDNK